MPVTPDDHFAQSGFDVRLEWGPNGLRRLAPHCAVIVIVDVLSFTTCVDVAVGRGAAVLPYRWHDGGEHDHAAAHHAVAAVGRDDVDADHPWSLSPASLATIAPGTRLVLPSPNGAALAFGAAEAGARTVVAACLRNATAVGRWLDRNDDGPVGLVPAGERWRGATGPLRPAIEDLLGAGAVGAHLAMHGRSLSPEAMAGAAVWRDAGDEISEMVHGSASGRELVLRGRSDDVEVACAVDTSEIVPVLRGEVFVDA